MISLLTMQLGCVYGWDQSAVIHVVGCCDSWTGCYTCGFSQGRFSITSGYTQAHAQVTLKGGSDKAAAAELADKEQTILELRETNEV